MQLGQSLILIPVFCQVVLTLVVVALLFRERVSWMVAQRIKPDEVALAGPSVWSEQAQKLSNNYSNLLELPLLFYVCAAFALSLQMVDLWMLILAGVFVLARIVHTVVHLGANRVMPRFYAVLVSLIAVSAMWVLLMWRVCAAGF